jgi:hypothetical protein
MPNLSRRYLVASAAALPALAVPAVAPELASDPDPIFAAIEKDRATDAAFIARCYYEDDLAGSGHKLTPAPDDHRTPEMVALVSASRAARAELANTAPTTLAGMVAYLDHVVSKSVEMDDLMFESGSGDGDDEAMDFVRSLARGARQIAREAVQS